MRILAIEREQPAPPRPDLSNLLRADAAGTWDLQQRGIIRDIWFTAADRRTVLLLECASAAEARQHLAALPLLRRGVVDFTVHELCPYDGFARLFSAGAAPAAPRPPEPPEY